jgi:PrtD family type I secretion system ABC transporter
MNVAPTPRPNDPVAAAIGRLRPAFVAVFAFSLFINLLVFVPAIFSLQIYDRVLTSRNATTLLMLVALTLGLLIAYAALAHERTKILVQAGVRFHRETVGPAFDAALHRAQSHRGEQHAQIVRDVEAIRDFLAGPALATLMDAPWVPVFIIVCFMFHPLLGLVALGGAAVLLLVAWINEMRTKVPLIESSMLSIKAHDRLSAALRNSEAIRGLGMAEAIRHRWSSDHEGAHGRAVLAHDRAGVLLSFSQFVRLALQIAILGTGAWLALRQEISPGVMFAASLMMGRALSPIEQAVGQWRAFVAARAARQRLTTIFATMPQNDATRVILPKPKGAVLVEGLTLCPPGTLAPTLKRVSFALEPGQVLAIVGPTGSGKSTLVRGLIGAWPAAQGSVRIDGNQIDHYAADALGRAIGFLPQSVELFGASVADNIARFDAARDDARVIEAAMKARAHDMIQRFPNGYDTPVGEDGVALSGGQRQRVGLARALYGDPSIIILDEPNSNLDGAGDQALVEVIRTLTAEGKTVIVVTHKPNVLESASHILILHEGEARRFGPTAEVLPLILPHARVSPGPIQTARVA